MRAKVFERWAAKVGMPDGDHGCMIWLAGKNSDGYGQLSVEGKKKYVHRLAYEHYVGPIPLGMCVLHKCDTPACCHPDHLSIGTVQQNMADKVAKGRSSHIASRGCDNGNAKLTEAGVRKIKNLYLDGLSQRAIAKIMTVSQSQISSILNGKNWSHVTLDLTTSSLTATKT